MISRGSEWRRWDPHIHTPGTLLNNQFRGVNAWNEYLTTLEGQTPKIEVIGVTDYYITENYEKLKNLHQAGRLPDIKMIFPNIELRLDVSARTGFVNIHLLVNPEDPEHLTELQRILSRLKFPAYDDRFDCTRNDLIKLGKRVDPSITEDHIALQRGATQFKVNFHELRVVYSESEWAKKNILIAVAGGSDDGTSGLRQAADTTIRQEIEKFAHIIFASSVAQREFWLGERTVSINELNDRYNGQKPCLHGSDSHDQNTVGQPNENRFTWIKGDPIFDSLRQTCIDPAGRAFVGSEPPSVAIPSQVISNVSIANATWAQTPKIPLNPGLVAIIGARGSGKTALVDMIAAGSDSISPTTWNADENTSPSFLNRAKPLIGDANVTLTWGGGDENIRFLDGRDADSDLYYHKIRYLSQQFVEDLCSSSGISDGLINEIERVIFETHPIDEREGAVDFYEFKEYKTNRFRHAREREIEAISNISNRIAIELEKESMVDTLSLQVAQKKALIKNYNSDISKLVVKGNEEQVKRYEELGEVAQLLKNRIQAFTNQRHTFLAMKDEVASTRATKAPEMLRQAQERHKQSGLSDKQWDEFLLIYKGDVDKSLTGYMEWVNKKIAELSGHPLQPGDPNKPVIASDVTLTSLDLSTIVAEMKRLEGLISENKVIRDQYTTLTKRIIQENSALKTLESKLEDAKGALDRRKNLQGERDDAYRRIFEAIINEESALTELYAPLLVKLTNSSGTLKKLGFYVRRVVDICQWGAYAEENLLDRRKAGPFNGRGTFTDLVKEKLEPGWEKGTAIEIQEAMTNFISHYFKDILAHAPYAPTQQDEYKKWLNKFAHWLYGTEHISVQYEIVYDGTDIRKLSPGTRGIVLLLLYLALDETDDRPLIIDQPEENLDPKSVNEELVPLFTAAKVNRQVIIITHNANLVVNTDADQIIIAEAGPHQIGGLPPISYRAGGIENDSIRKAVCNILEGGEAAFLERARRLRVRLER